jgi:hypothetical protein
MKKYLFRFFLLAVTLIISDVFGGILLTKILDSSPDGRYFKTIYTLDKSKEEIIVFGSSRAEANYVPAVFDQILEKKTWNAGRGGQGLPFWYSLFLGMKGRHIPEIAIINVENDFLREGDNTESFERAGFLRPFYKTHPPLQKIINQISSAEPYLIKSDFYAFNSSYYYLIRPYFFKGVDGKIEDKGWKPLTGKMKINNLEIKSINDPHHKIDMEMEKMFLDFVGELTKKGCKVFVCISPDFGRKVIETSTINYLRSINEIKLIDYSAVEEFIVNPDLYKDKDHLNFNGAKKYSEAIANEIKIKLGQN